MGFSGKDDMLGAAIRYRARGWRVLPAHGKKAAISWSAGNVPSPEVLTGVEATLRRWWEDEFPGANVALACGRDSGVIVLDIDGEKGWESLEARNLPPLPSGPVAITGRGPGHEHHYFRHPGGRIIRSLNKMLENVDAKADGGYVILPGSVHPDTGRHYAWKDGTETLPLPECPQWLLDLLEGRREPQRQTPRESGAETLFTEGGRNDSLYRLGCSLRAKGLAAEAIRASLLSVNAVQCSPPLPEREVVVIARQAARHSPGTGRQADASDPKEGRSGGRDAPMPYDDAPLGDAPDFAREGSYFDGEIGMWVHDAAEAKPADARADDEALFALRRTIDTSVALPPIDMIGGLFPRKYVSLVIAAPGTGKTWFIQRLASDLSVGGAVFDGFAETEPRRVMILAGEAGYELLIRRGTETRWPVNVDNIDVFSAIEATLGEIDLDLDKDEGKRRIEALIDKFKPDIAIIDTLSSFHLSDENSAKEMGPLFRYLLKLAADKEIALVAVHHTRKRKTSERGIRMNQDETIGSSIMIRLSAMIVGLEETRKDLAIGEKPTILVWTQKAWFRKPSPFAFRLGEDEYGRTVMDIDLDPALGGFGGMKDQIYIYLQTRYQPGEWFTPKNVIDGLKGKMSDSYVRKCLWELAERGTLTREGENRWVRYAITAEGTAAETVAEDNDDDDEDYTPF